MIISTLIIPGTAFIKEITTTLSPLFLDITLRGLKTLSILSALIKERSTEGKE